MSEIPEGWERCDWATPWPNGCQDGRAWRFGLRSPDLADGKTPHRWWQADATTAFVIHEQRDRPSVAQRSTEEDPLRRHLWDAHRWRDAPQARPDGWSRIKDPTRWHAFEHEHEANWGEPHSHDA